jgi:hypothetical protein
MKSMSLRSILLGALPLLAFAAGCGDGASAPTVTDALLDSSVAPDSVPTERVVASDDDSDAPPSRALLSGLVSPGASLVPAAEAAGDMQRATEGAGWQADTSAL